jgi:hypothetical protein
MAQIQPITTFYNGESVQLTNFNLSSIGDNLSLTALQGVATFYYELQMATTDLSGNTIYQNVITANLTISGADYDSWGADPNSNQWAYNWAAQQLNLTLV